MKFPYKWQATLVVCLGMVMAILDSTIVSVTLPQMQKAFHTDFTTITWVATAYFLAQAAVIPIVGYLSDRIGTKTVFLTSLVLFTLASALCAFAPTKELLIIFRVLQGIGGGALMPVAFAVIYREFPPTERAMVTAVVGIPLLVAPAFGPTLGGYLSSTFDWSAIFTINIPIGILTVILAFLILRGRQQEYENNQDVREKKRFDILGLLLSMVGFTTLVYGMTEAGSRGWSDTTTLTFLSVGVVVLIAFVINELVVKDPVIDLRLFTNYTFTISNLLLWMVSAVLYGSIFLIPFFFENVQGSSSLTAGELLIGQGLASAVSITSQVFGAIGVSVLSTYLTQQTINHGNDVNTALHNGQAPGFAASCALYADHNLLTLKGCLAPYLMTMGLNDTFLIVTIGCAFCAVLTIFVGRDPAIEAAKRAKASGEEAVVEHVTLLTE